MSSTRSSIFETLFDFGEKQARRDALEQEMNSATFWNDQEKAKGVIQELKSLNTVLKPFEALVRQADNLGALDRAGRGGRDRRIRRRDPGGLRAGGRRFRGVRVPLDARRAQRPLQRLRDDPRRRRRDRGLRLVRDAAAHVPDVGRVQAVLHRDHRPRRRRRGRNPGGDRSTSRASTPTAISAARRASIAWSGSARSTPTRGGTPRLRRSTSCPRSTRRSTSCSATKS